MGDSYEVVMDGGGPWGIRLQGGKDFGVPLNVARVTPGSKASMKGLMAGDSIMSINNNETEQLTHMEAQNLIKGAGDRLQLRLKKGSGVSLGDTKDIGAGGFKPAPQQTLYQTDVTHSAGVDHKFNAKPKSFITSTNASAGGTSHVSVPLKKFDPAEYSASKNTSAESTPVKKFDPGEYARKKKEELESYKKDAKPDVDSDVLRMLKKTSVADPKQQSSGLNHSAEGQPYTPEGDVAFRMTADGTDLADVSPGSRAVMDDIRNRGTSSLSSGGAQASGGSRSFRLLQHMTSTSQDPDEDLPPPPPDMFDTYEGGSDYVEPGSPPQVQSSTFRMLEQHVNAGTGDQVRTGLDNRSRHQSQGSLPSPPIRTTTNTNTPVTVNPIPKAPFPTGPNFKVGRAAAPTFRASVGGAAAPIGARAPPPPAVNAGEIVNPNSRIYQTNAYPAGQPQSPGYAANLSNNVSSPAYGRDPPQSTRNPSFSSGVGVPPPQSPREPAYSPGVPTQSPRNPVPGVPTLSPRNPVPGRAPLSTSGDKKLVCQACDQPMTGPFVSAIGKTWHPEHFCCSSCHISLQNQAFVEENSKLFCEKCYNQFYAPKCAHCNNAIIGNCVNALGKSWHPDHFICSFCNRSFGNEGFLVDNGRPYCGKCFDDLFSVKCGKCGQPITGGEKYVEALNKNWHSECFSCNYCNVRLEGNSFYVNRGMAYCHQHKSAVL